MAIKASDLSYAEKQQVLAQVRSRLNSEQYDQLVEAVGEDGIINMILQKAESQTAGKSASSPAAEKSGSPVFKTAFWVTAGLGLLAGAGFPDFQVLTSTWNQSYGVILAIVIVVALLIWVLSLFKVTIPNFFEAAVFITLAITIPWSLLVNLSQYGLNVVWISLILFAVFLLSSLLFVVPVWRWIGRARSRFVAGLLHTVEVLVVSAAALVAWVYVYAMFPK